MFKILLEMNIPYMTHWPERMGPPWAGQPTYFPEKVLRALLDFYSHYDWEAYSLQLDAQEQPVYQCTMGVDFAPKPHTIRKNKKKRYRAGVLLQPYIWAGRPYQSGHFKFAPKFPCTGTQRITITHSGEKWRMPWVTIDGRLLTAPEIKQLAINDGFESTQQFFAWFSEDFKGDIIHFTDLRY